MTAIRPFYQDDIPQVAELHARVFGKIASRRLGPSDLALYEKYFREVFFENPWYQESFSSLVCEGHDSGIIGFLGVVPRPMVATGTRIHACTSSQFMVDPASRSTLAGIKLLRSYLSGLQDLSIADSANNFGRKIWEGLGGVCIPASSIRWIRILRPGRYAVQLMTRRDEHFIAPAVIRPFGSMIDRIAARRWPHRFHQAVPLTSEEPLSAEQLLAFLPPQSGKEAVYPEYDAKSLEWLLNRARQKTAVGNFRSVVILDKDRGVLGTALYYVKKGGVAEVLHTMVSNGSLSRILDHLFFQAWESDCVAICGRLESKHMADISEKHCLLTCGSPWMLVHSKNRQLTDMLRCGDASIGRLEGEWCQRFQTDATEPI